MPGADTKTMDLMAKLLDELAINAAQRVKGLESGRTLTELIWVDGQLKRVSITPTVVHGEDKK